MELLNFDVITGYASGEQINAPTSVAASTLTTLAGNALSLSAADIAAVLTNGAFTANSARAFTATGQNGSIFIALNNGTAGFSAATDSIIQLQGYSLGSVAIV